MSKQLNSEKLSFEKFRVSKINNQKMIMGGDDGGGQTIQPTSKTTRPTVDKPE